MAYFLRLGATGFGGPIALAGAMQRDLVETRRWVTKEEYMKGLALAQLAPVVELLARDGVDVRDFKPRRVEWQDVEDAARVISIDCDFAGERERWDDVPKVSEDPEGAAEAIRRHVEELVRELRGT